MRKVAFFLVLTFVVYIAATYFLGGQARQQYFAFLAELNASEVVKVSNISYQQGLFYSKAKTFLEFAPSLHFIGHGQNLVLDHDFIHGPWPVNPGQDLLSTHPMLAMVITKIGESTEQQGAIPVSFGLERATSTWEIPFIGPVLGNLSVPLVEWEEDRGKVGLHGCQADLVYDYKNSTIQLQVDLNQIRIASQADEFVLEGVHGDAFLGDTEAPFLNSQVSLDIASLRARAMHGPFILENIHLNLEGYTHETLVHIAQGTHIQKIIVNNEVYGPLQWDLSLRNIHCQVLETFAQHVVDAQNNKLLEYSSDMTRTLLAHNPQVHLSRLQLVTPDGDLTATFQGQVHPPAPWAWVSPFLLLAYVDLLGEIRAHEPLVQKMYRQWAKKQPGWMGDEDLSVLKRQYRDQLATLTKRNLIVQEGDELTSVLSYKKGQLQINGYSVSWF